MTLPRCNCQLLCIELSQKKEGPNQGRSFFKCPKDRNDSSKCDFFEWKSGWIDKISDVKFDLAPPPTNRASSSTSTSAAPASAPVAKKLFSSRRAPSSTPSTRPAPTEPLPLEPEPKIRKMVRPIPEENLKPVEQHMIDYKVVMSDVYDVKLYPHVNRFISSAESCGYNVKLVSKYEMSHRMEHVVLSKGAFQELERFTVLVQPRSKIEARQVVRLQTHAPQLDKHGWIIDGQANFIAFQTAKNWVLVDRCYMRKFMVRHVKTSNVKVWSEANKIAHVPSCINPPDFFDGDTDPKHIIWGDYHVNACDDFYGEQWSNVYLDHLVAFVSDNSGRVITIPLI